jgi:hypothetical protein
MNLLKQTTALLVVTLVLGTAGCSNSSNDAAITSRVQTAISKEPGLNGTKLSVSTDKKVVHLSGTVKSRAERAMAIAVARKVDGVKAVKTDLLVAPQPKVAPQQKPRVEARRQQKPVVEAREKRQLRTQHRVTPRDADIRDTGR